MSSLAFVCVFLAAAVARADSGPVVDDYLDDENCSTEVVRGLSLQIAGEVACLEPTALGPFAASTRLVLGSAVLPFLAPDARADLLAAVAMSSATMHVNSGYRTAANQYLLVNWFHMGRCGITEVADVGYSDHESGRSIDIDDNADWIATLADHGWSHPYPGDPVHFDHTDSRDLRGLDILAFQRLWNRNNPTDMIDEDGDYGDMTAARLGGSPADGFVVGATCPPDAGAVVPDAGAIMPDAGAPDAGVADARPPEADARGNDAHSGNQTLSGGCTVGARGQPPAWLALLLIVPLCRRRRRS